MSSERPSFNPNDSGSPSSKEAEFIAPVYNLDDYRQPQEPTPEPGGAAAPAEPAISAEIGEVIYLQAHRPKSTEGNESSNKKAA